jgi:hypothetical protein
LAADAIVDELCFVIQTIESGFHTHTQDAQLHARVAD